MKQNYFIHNGKQYNTGTSIYIKWISTPSCKMCKRMAKFISYDTDEKKYTFEIEKEQYAYSEKDFYDIFCGVYGEPNPQTTQRRPPKKATFKDELNIDGLLLAWVWYVFIMAVSIIFHGAIFIWIIASTIFFNYRKRKLKEAGYQ